MYPIVKFGPLLDPAMYCEPTATTSSPSCTLATLPGLAAVTSPLGPMTAFKSATPDAGSVPTRRAATTEPQELVTWTWLAEPENCALSVKIYDSSPTVLTITPEPVTSPWGPFTVTPTIEGSTSSSNEVMPPATDVRGEETCGA